MTSVAEKLKATGMLPMQRKGSRLGGFFPREIVIAKGTDGQPLLNIGFGTVELRLTSFAPLEISKVDFRDPVSSAFKSISPGADVIAARETLKPGEAGEVLLAVWKLSESGEPTRLLLQVVEQKSDGTIDSSKAPSNAGQYYFGNGN